MREVYGPAPLDMEFEFLQVLPMHDCKHLIGEACNLLNSEWPRSKTARYQSLFMSCDKFPTSLVLVLNDFQVVGHVKLSEITVKGPDIMVESVIISKEHRGKGWGKMLMEDAEEYVRRRGKKMLYLSTRGQEGFYEKLGYEVCKPILYYGVALEPSSDGEIKVNDHCRNKNGCLENGGAVVNVKNCQPFENGNPVENGVIVQDCNVENGRAVNNCNPVANDFSPVKGNPVEKRVEIRFHCVENGDNVENIPKNGHVDNGFTNNRHRVENVPLNNPNQINSSSKDIPRCAAPSTSPIVPPPPPPLPVNNVKSHTIFRDIKSSKTYMGKSVRTSSHFNFLSKECL